MGQVSVLQGILHFLLHSAAIIAALLLIGRVNPIRAWQWWGLPLLSFAVAFAAHILAFIVLKQFASDDTISPWLHRPVVSIVWGLSSGLTVLLLVRAGLPSFWLAAALSTLAYLLFVFLRPLI